MCQRIKMPGKLQSLVTGLAVAGWKCEKVMPLRGTSFYFLFLFLINLYLMLFGDIL